MKKVFITLLFAVSMMLGKASTSSNLDTAQLKERFDQVEKLVKQLQKEVTDLKATDRTRAAEIAALKESLPAAKQKKLVIDRRGSKQATFQ